MPTYEYACTSAECGNRFELVQAFTDPAASECPTCAGGVRKVFSAVGVVFKGSGFYRTDSRAGSASGTDSGVKSGDSGSSAGDSSSGSSSDSASAGAQSTNGSAPAAKPSGNGSAPNGSSSRGVDGAVSKASPSPAKTVPAST